MPSHTTNAFKAKTGKHVNHPPECCDAMCMPGRTPPGRALDGGHRSPLGSLCTPSLQPIGRTISVEGGTEGRTDLFVA